MLLVVAEINSYSFRLRYNLCGYPLVVDLKTPGREMTEGVVQKNVAVLIWYYLTFLLCQSLRTKVPPDACGASGLALCSIDVSLCLSRRAVTDVTLLVLHQKKHSINLLL